MSTLAGDESCLESMHFFPFTIMRAQVKYIEVVGVVAVIVGVYIWSTNPTTDVKFCGSQQHSSFYHACIWLYIYMYMAICIGL